MPEAKMSSPALVDRTGGNECVINRIVTAGYFGSQHVVVLATNQVGVVDGEPAEVSAIVARLRFDNEMAIMLRDALDQSIRALQPPADQLAN